VEITPDRTADIATAMGVDGDRAAGRFKRVCRCFAIESQGGIVSYGWVSTTREWIGELNLWITPAPGEAYVWNCFTLEPFRRRGHYRSLLYGLVGLAGLQRLWIGSIEVPAEKADADAGFEPVLHFTSTTLGPMRWLRTETAPGAPASMVEAAKLRLGVARSRSLARAQIRIH
jgi:hypothetical protein